MLRPGDHIVEYADDYLHGVLSTADAAYVESHCERCRICQVAMEEARRRQAALEALPATEASEQLVQATLTRIETHGERRRRATKWFGIGVALATAASVAIIAGFHVYFLWLSATPYDLQLLGQTELLAGAPGSLRVRLQQRDTGRPMSGVPVEIKLHCWGTSQSVTLASFTTNEQGTGQPRFQLPDWVDGDCELRVTAQPNGKTETIARNVRLKRSWQVMLSSDKPVYQPGQQIRLRSLALRRPDLKPVAGQETVFSIGDPNKNVIFKQKGTTSNYGIASADCPLATEILEGPYTVECRVGDTSSKLTVEVKKYVLPKFKIDADLDQPFYQPGQRVKGSVHAHYFFGKPVAGGKVEVDVQTADVASRSIRKLTADTDETGHAAFDFLLPASLVGTEKESGAARIAVQVTVADTAGQKQTRTVSRVVTSQPIRIEVIPEAGSLVSGVANKVYLFAGYADGRPAKARLKVSGVEQDVVTSDLGVAAVELTPDTAGELGLTISATDDKGLIGRRHVRLKAGTIGQDFVLRTDKATYDGGETMHLAALGGGREPVFVDFIKHGQTILTEVIDMSDGRGEYQFDLPPDLFGTVELCAYRFGAEGLAVRKTRAIYIRQARRLNIRTLLDRKEYRPGDAVRLQVALTDHEGKPTPGAVSLAAVDEAVFSVLERMPSLEQRFFTLEQELLKPIYAIYPWAPDLSTSLPPQEREQFEQALFARTATQAQAGSPNRERQRAGAFVELPPDDEPGPSRSRFGEREARPVHSLLTSSYPAKVQEIELTRQAGLDAVRIAWRCLVVLLLAVAYVAVWTFLSLRAVLILHGIGIVLLCGVSLSLTVFLVGAKVSDTFWLEASARAPAGGAGPGEGIGTAMGSGRFESVRVRELFPETLLWRPELITDDNGQASIDVELADSITTWRLTASAVSQQGQLGGAHSSIRVFQPFFVDLNLPVALTRGDEVAVPVVVYNYLDRPQTVDLKLEDAGWFHLMDEPMQQLKLAANEVRSTSYRLKVNRVGSHQLQVTARGSGVADAIKRTIEIVPDGRRVEQVFNGTLERGRPGRRSGRDARAPVELTLSVPETAIEGSPKAILKIYPSSFSQLVEGLDGIFQRPYGCFEQTSSTTYPNVLALDYLRRNKKSLPEVEAKARQYVHLGYQRLVSFEVPGGGFDWFGRGPANRSLTAYGLMEFQDMARVHDVDPQLLGRTRRWLLGQRNRDGSWSPDGGSAAVPAAGAGGTPALRTTAYIAWAVYTGQASDSAARVTLDYLLAHRPESMNDPYVLALVCNALLAIDPKGQEVKPYLDRLEAMKQMSEDGKLAWWTQSANARTTFYGAGRSGSIETTALAALALVTAGEHPATARGALAWLVAQKDASGTWHSTQGTVLALKALLAGTGQPLGGDRERRILIEFADGKIRDLLIPVDQADVMKQMDLSEYLTAGTHRVTLSEESNTGAGYQLAFRYHVPGGGGEKPREPLAIELGYDRTELEVGQEVTATAKVVNNLSQTAPMVILDLPIPAGFAVASEDFAAMVASKSIEKFQVTPRSVIVYLRELKPATPLTLRYQLRPTMPVNISVPAARAYEYYDPDKQAMSAAARLTVTARK